MAEQKNNAVAVIEFKPDDITLLKSTVVPKETTESELKLFLNYCKKTGLDPFTRQIYAMKTKDKFSVMSSIDGLRLVAQRSGEYEGQTAPMWADNEGVWHDVWVKKEHPAAAKVGVYRKDFKEPCYGIARFETYAQKKYDGTLQYNWGKMPDLMIAKCAEALALRKAFPNELSGIYTNDEMQNFIDENKSKDTVNNGAVDYGKIKAVQEEAKKDNPYFIIGKSATLDELKANFNKFKSQPGIDVDLLTKAGSKRKEELLKEIENASNVVPVKVDDFLKTANTGEIYQSFITKLKDAFMLEQLETYYGDICSDADYKLLDGDQVKSIEKTYNVLKSKFEKDPVTKGTQKKGKAA